MAIQSFGSSKGIEDSNLENAFSNLNIQSKQEKEDSKQVTDYSKERATLYSNEPSGGIWRLQALDVSRVISASYDHTLKIWPLDLQNQTLKFNKSNTITAYKREALSIAKIHDKLFAAGSSDGTLTLIDTTKEVSIKESLKDKNPTGFYSMTAVDGNILATGSCQKPKDVNKEWKHVIKIWDLSKKEFKFQLEGHEGGIAGLVSLNEKTLVSVSADTTVKVWDLANKKLLSTIEGHKDYVYGIAQVDKSKVITGSRDKALKFWDIEGGKLLASFESQPGSAHASTVYDVNTYEGRLAVSGSRDGCVKVWDLKSLKCIKNLDPTDGFIYAANFFPDGNLMAGTSGKIQQAAQKGLYSKKKVNNNAHVVVWDFRVI